MCSKDGIKHDRQTITACAKVKVWKMEMAAFNTKLFSSKEIIDQIDMEVQQGCQYRLFSQFL